MLMMLALLFAFAAVQPAADADGLTPLMRAAASGDTAQVTALLEGGADANVVHAQLKLTPLMFAAYFGHDAAAQQLLDKGARLNLKDAAGASAADWAVQGGHQGTADVLIRAGAQLNPFLNAGVLPFGVMDKAAGKAP